MNRKTILHLIAYIILCLSGFFTGILGLAEIFGNIFVENVQLPIHLAIASFISGMFSFIVGFTRGIDHETWEKLK